MSTQLPRSFFQRPAPEVAPDLLGEFLVYRQGNEITRSIITETEAYHGEEDRANHASRGKTDRTRVMYEKGGIFYIYLIYGMYWMLNIVTGEKKTPSAVLIRATREVAGPGRLTRELGITKELNGKTVNRQNGFWIEKGEEVKKGSIKALPRIGVAYAGEWSEVPYRFVLKDETLPE